MNISQDLIDFLKINGFTHNKEKHNFTNNHCIITIEQGFDESGETCDYYCVDTNKGTSYSYNLEIYWLIGYLTYYGYMDKDYKKP